MFYAHLCKESPIWFNFKLQKCANANQNGDPILKPKICLCLKQGRLIVQANKKNVIDCIYMFENLSTWVESKIYKCVIIDRGI